MVRKQKDRKINQRSFYFEDYNNYSNTQFNFKEECDHRVITYKDIH